MRRMSNPKTPQLVLSVSAVRRLQEDCPGLGVVDAARYLRGVVASGRSRSIPRHWMRALDARAGTRFVYSADDPDRCVLVYGGAIIGLFVRGDELVRPDQAPPRSRPARSTQRARFWGQDLEAA